MSDPGPGQILAFWFDEIPNQAWFRKDTAFDREVADRFGAIHRTAAAGELFSWRGNADGRLAEIIVLDQFSRNIFRDQPGAFASDPQALVLAQEAVGLGLLDELPAGPRQAFLLMPYMHSESAIIHEQAVRLYDRPGLENNLDFETRHKAIIDRFGRYPHRNAILGRQSTEEELAFLAEPGSSF